ncbi:poly(A) RNA polymerase cid11-like [Apium graveolens]|uniref:poly(A) RNA polymerase cid11-like n=1 Tax=Apium graveolens TaxID=4045 RepID=UPI003D7AF205
MESSSLSAERLDFMNSVLKQIYDSIVPKDETVRQWIVKLIAVALSRQFGREIEVRLYGSCAMELQLQHSDIDITVVLHEISDEEKFVAWKEIYQALSRADEFVILKEHETHRQLMVVEHKLSGTLVDVTLNNFEPAFIAKFVQISVAAHPLVKILLLTLKKWFKDQEVTKNMLPSVSSALMGISYLQKRNYLPLLPTKELVGDKGTQWEFFDSALSMYKDLVEQSKENKPFDNLCLGKIVYDCFVHFSTHNFREDVVSILGGKPFKKETLKWEDHYFAILDPFSWEDKGHKVTRNESNKLQACFKEAARILRDDDLFFFCKPYKFDDITRRMGILGNTSQDAEIAVVMMQEGRAEISLIGKEIGGDELDCRDPTLPLKELEDMKI